MKRLTQDGVDYCKNICGRMPVCARYYAAKGEMMPCGDAAIYNKLRDYEDTSLEPEEIEHRLKNERHWATIWMAEADDRLIILPCKVGDTVYRICHEYKKGNPFIRAVTFNQNNFWRIVFGGEIGKTVFLTRAEAEAALRGGADG